MNKNIETNVVKPSLAIHQNDTEYRLLSTESEVSLDSKIKAIEDLMLNNSGKGKTEEEKDKLYSDAQILWKDYYVELVKTKYTFFLTRKQYQFLTETLRDKIEYDVNTLFFAIELTDMLGNWIKEQKYSNDKELKGFQADATEVTYIYHIISKHKVKGLSHSAYTFADVLRRIGDISKVIAYYDTASKNLSASIQDWVASFDPNVSIENKTTTEATTIAPSGKSKKVKAETE